MRRSLALAFLGGPGATCESVERATSLKYTLGSAFAQRYRAVEETPDEAAFHKALEGVTAGLVAIGAGARGGTVSTWLQLPQLAHLSGARDLLVGASEYLGTHYPVYVDVQSEGRICAPAVTRPLG